MGVTVKMVTGDALAIGKEIAKALGMGTNILDAACSATPSSDEARRQLESIEDADGFAQVFPEHKFHIVDVLQKHGHIVGMTGDGVNDAPALKKADCGIAVSGATDAARAAASIVLMTPGLSVIIDAIKESRRIFQRMNSYAIYRIAETLRVLLFMTLAILIFNFYPAHSDHDRDAGVAQRRRHPVHRLRQRPLQEPARGLEHAPGARIATVLGRGRPHRRLRPVLPRRPRVSTSTIRNCRRLMYLMLSVAGHLTIFLTRTRGPWWSTRPARILLAGGRAARRSWRPWSRSTALLDDTLGWRWALAVWGYALTWFLLTDPGETGSPTGSSTR